MPSRLILPANYRPRADTPETNVRVFVPTAAVFPGTQSTDAALVQTLQPLCRDDVLFQCALVNRFVSGMEKVDIPNRQQTAVLATCNKEQIDRINAFAKSRTPPVVFVRGQMLELMRWASRHCRRTPGNGNTFNDPAVRSAFVKAALLAGEAWSRRVYGDAFVIGDRSTGEARRRAMGRVRKGIDESNPAPHLGVAIGRGRILFGSYMPKHMGDFDEAFRRETGLTVAEYLTCASAMATYVIPSSAVGPLFNVATVADTTIPRDVIHKFIERESQRADALEEILWRDFDAGDYKGLRERPIVVSETGNAVILDPTFYTEKISAGPLFHAVGVISRQERGGANRVFGAFGKAFERYANDAFERMYPRRPGLADRVVFGAEKLSKNGPEFDVDAFMVEPLGGTINAVVFETKASFLPEKDMLGEPEKFIETLREKYGRSKKNKDRDKGVAQLARIIGAAMRREWLGPEDEMESATVYYPVLLVHDARLDSPGVVAFLNDDFKALLGKQPDGIRVAPLIVLSIEDLESLESSVGPFGLMEIIEEYDRRCPDRSAAFQTFLGESRFATAIRPSQHVMKAAEAQMDETVSALFRRPPDGLELPGTVSPGIPTPAD